MYDKYELEICDSILIVCPMNDQFMPFYPKNKNEYCFNLIDSSKTPRQKNKTKTGSSKPRLQYTDSQLNKQNTFDAVKKGMFVYAGSKTFGVPYHNKISGKAFKKIQHCGYKLVSGEHIENKLVE